MAAGAQPDPVARVARFLADAGAEARLQQFPEGTATAEAAADAIGCTIDQIVKSLLYVCDNALVLAMVPGGARADPERVRVAMAASNAKLLAKGLVEKTTGFPVGGVAPFPLPGLTSALLDESLLRHELVWIGAGSDRHMAGVSPQELVRLTRARTLRLTGD